MTRTTSLMPGHHESSDRSVKVVSRKEEASDDFSLNLKVTHR